MADLAELLCARERRLATATRSLLRQTAGGLDALAHRVAQAQAARLAQLRSALDAASRRPCLQDPTYALDRRAAELAQTADRLAGAIVRDQGRHREPLEIMGARLQRSTSGLSGKRHALELASSRLADRGRSLLADPKSALSAQAAALDALSPLKVLARGYSIAYDEAGVATSAERFEPGSTIRVALADGEVTGTVTKVERGRGDLR